MHALGPAVAALVLAIEPELSGRDRAIAARGQRDMSQRPERRN